MRRMEIMRLSAVLAIGAILAQTFVFANYTIVHRRTFNLNTTFAGAEAIGDVAFDGNNLYVSSWHNAAGVQTVRLVQVGDINTLLGTNSGALTPSGWSVTVSAAGGSRDTRLVYHDNHLYWGYGLGDGAAANTGIRKYDLNGNLVTGWASGGTLTLSGAGVNRYDTIDIDPGYSGSGETLAVGVFGSTIVRRFDLSTGANAGNADLWAARPPHATTPSRPTATSTFALKARLLSRREPPHQARLPSIPPRTSLLGPRAHWRKPSSPTSP